VTRPATAARAEQLAHDLDVQIQTHLVRRSFAQLQQQAAALRNGTNPLSRTPAARSEST